MENIDYIVIPDSDTRIYPNTIVRLGRFSEEQWQVQVGWYTWGGNRPVCGWYLTSLATGVIKPLQYPDLYDIYTVEASG